MDSMKRFLKEIVLPGVILLLVIMACTLTGCATIETTRVTITDPSHLRVGIFLDTPQNYRLKFEGAITGWKESRDSFSLHAECSGRFEGVIHAYKVIGKGENGDEALFYMGEQKYSFRTDGRNTMYRGESYDDIVVISSYFRRYSNIPFGAEKTHFPFYVGPCGSKILPDVKFRWGK